MAPMSHPVGRLAERQGRSSRSPPCLSRCAPQHLDGGGMHLIRYVVYHLRHGRVVFTQILRWKIPRRYRRAVFRPFSALQQRQPSRPDVRVETVMKNENLKSTTVRFTDSDLHLIDSLQEKLGLGMIHVIRLAIRRLAESENLMPAPSAPKKQ